MVKPGDLVRYAWSQAVGLVLEVARDENSDRVILLVEWPQWYAEEMNAKSRKWWTREDRFLIKVGKETSSG